MIIRRNTGKSYPGNRKKTKDNDSLRLKLLQHQKAATDHTSKKDLNNTNIIGNALMEGFKKVCWGDRYDENDDNVQGRFTGDERGHGETPQAHRIRMRNKKPKPKPEPKPIPGISGDTSKLTIRKKK